MKILTSRYRYELNNLLEDPGPALILSMRSKVSLSHPSPAEAEAEAPVELSLSRLAPPLSTVLLDIISPNGIAGIPGTMSAFAFYKWNRYVRNCVNIFQYVNRYVG